MTVTTMCVRMALCVALAAAFAMPHVEAHSAVDKETLRGSVAQLSGRCVVACERERAKRDDECDDYYDKSNIDTSSMMTTCKTESEREMEYCEADCKKNES